MVESAQRPRSALRQQPTNQNLTYNMTLEKVVGMASTNQNSIALNPINSDLCYLAGCYIVVYNQKENKQVKHIASRTQRPFQSLTFSPDGKFLAAGETAFKSPEICIYRLKYREDLDSIKKEEKEKPAEKKDDNDQLPPSGQKPTNYNPLISVEPFVFLKGHKYGVEALRFSKDSKYLISLGDTNDKGLFVWDWKKEKKISSNKLSKPVISIAFSDNNDFFVTGGYQHLKYWYFDEQTNAPIVQNQGTKDAIMQSQAAVLEKVKVKIFVGIAIDAGKVYALTTDGFVYVFDKQRKLLRWMSIKVDRAFDCYVSQGKLFCACSDGILRIFKCGNLEHVLTMSRPPPLGDTNILLGIKKVKLQATDKTKYADIMAVTVDDINQRIVALYSDKMCFIWDVKNLKQVSVYRTFLSHCSAIHDIQLIPNELPLGTMIGQNNQAENNASRQSENNTIPRDSEASSKGGVNNNASTDETSKMMQDECLTKFVTCSSDRTIRFWHYIDGQALNDPQKYNSITKQLARNAYCKDMSKMVFVQSNEETQKELDQKASQNQALPSKLIHFLALPLDRGEDGTPLERGVLAGDNNRFREVTDAIRCVKVSPDGKQLACGDWLGNIRIYNIEGTEIQQKMVIEAHDNEVICLAFSPDISSSSSTIDAGGQSKQQRFLLASGSRDKNICIFDSGNDYQAISVIQNHCHTVTSLNFYQSKTEKDQIIELISGSADKTVVTHQMDLGLIEKCRDNFEQLQLDGTDLFKLKTKEASKNKVYSMDVAEKAKCLVSGHDKQISLWKLPNLQKLKQYNLPECQSQTEVSLRTHLDPSASVILSSSSSKAVTLYEIKTGSVLARACHGEMTTAMCLSQNMRQLITASDRGIIYVWRLPEELADELNRKKKQQEDIFSDDFQFDLPKPVVAKKQEEKKPASTNNNDVQDVLGMISKANNLISGLGEPQKNVKAQESPAKDLNGMAKPLDTNQLELPCDVPDWAKSIIEDPSAQNSKQMENKPVEVIAISAVNNSDPLAPVKDDIDPEMEELFQKNLERNRELEALNGTDHEALAALNNKDHLKWFSDFGDDFQESFKEKFVKKTGTDNVEGKQSELHMSRNLEIMKSCEHLLTARKSITSMFVKKRTLNQKEIDQQTKNVMPQPGQENQHMPKIGSMAKAVQQSKAEAKIPPPAAAPNVKLNKELSTVADEVTDIIDDTTDVKTLPLNATGQKQQAQAPALGFAQSTNTSQRRGWGEAPQIPTANAQKIESKPTAENQNPVVDIKTELMQLNDKDLEFDFDQVGKINTRPTMVEDEVPVKQEESKQMQNNQLQRPLSNVIEDFNFDDPEDEDLIAKKVEKEPQSQDLPKAVSQQSVPLSNPYNTNEVMSKPSVNDLKKGNNSVQPIASTQSLASKPQLISNKKSPVKEERIREESKEDSIVKIEQSQNDMEGLNVFNATLKTEMDKITESLGRVQQLLASQKKPARPNQQSVNVKDDVTASIARNMELWNTMMTGLNEKTDLEVDKLSQHSSFAASRSSQQLGDMTFDHHQTNSPFRQSQFSQVSVKDDARDLLDKYSKLLLEQVQQTMLQTMNNNGQGSANQK